VIGSLMLRGVILTAVLGILTAGYFGWRGHQREIGAHAQRIIDQQEVDKIKAEAMLKLEAALKGKAEAEKKLRDAATAQGVKDAKNQNTVAGLTARLAALAAANTGQLRDPIQTSGCGSSSGGAPSTATASAGAGTDDASQAGGLLSPQLTGLLQRLTAEADAINLAYISCRGYATQ